MSGILFILIVAAMLVAALWRQNTRVVAVILLGILGGLIFWGTMGQMRVQDSRTPNARTLRVELSDEPVTSRPQSGFRADLASGEKVGPSAKHSSASAGESLALDPDSDHGASDETPVAAQPPAWVNETPKRVGEVYRTKVVSDPFATKRECDENLDGRIRQAAAEYIDGILGEDSFQMIAQKIDKDFLLREVCVDEFTERYQTQSGFYVYRVHMLMEFDPEACATLREEFRQVVLRDRLQRVGLGALLALGLVGAVFGYFTIDTATKGFYSGRLQLAAGVVIMGLLLTLAMFFRA